MCRSQDAISSIFKKHGLGSRSNTSTLSQPMKPMLPRKLTSSARINLNDYWNTLEEIVVPANIYQTDSENAINENLDNERRLALLTISSRPSVGGKTTGLGGRSPFSQHNGQDTCAHNGGSC